MTGATVHGNPVKVIAYDRGSSRYLIEYIGKAEIPEYPFKVNAAYRKWVGPLAVENQS